MIYVISKSTYGSYNVRDIQCNANWDCCPYSDYALIPESMVEGILATKGYCDITLNSAGTEVASFTARTIPNVPEECCGELSLDAGDIKTGTLPLERGGTNRDLSAVPNYAIIRAASDGKSIYYTPTANGAFFATGDNKTAKFGTLPVEQGGTNATTPEEARKNLGVGTNKVYNKLTDIGITTFPTTMKTVVNAMPNNSTLMLDSRDIITGGTNEISDLGLASAGMYMFMKGNSAPRVSLLNIYGATGATTSHMNYGCYAATNDTVLWYRALGTNNTADYVVAEGTSGIWTYRKWNSGVAECWGRYDSGNPVAGANVRTVTLPFNFTGDYIVNITPAGVGAHSHTHADCDNNTYAVNHSAGSFIFRYTYDYASLYSGSFNLHVLGKWK